MTIRYDRETLERFIPVAYEELLEKVLEASQLDAPQCRRMAAALRSWYHEQFYEQLCDLKRQYRPFNPDSDLISLQHYSQAQYSSLKQALVASIAPLLSRANYEELTQETLHEAMNKTSPYGVEVSVDFEDFEEIALFVRGEAHRYDTRRTWHSLYLKEERLRVDVYRRLFILLKPKRLQQRAQEIAARDGRSVTQVAKQLRKKSRVLLDEASHERIYMKLFKDIPHADLEMLFPNTVVKMTLQDKLKLGVTGGGGTIGGAVTLMGKIGAMAEPLSLLAAVGAFGGVLWRQVKSVFTHRTRYMATLAKHLYFYNLDNNVGVLTHLVDMAESEESKEALLAYLFLLQHGAAMSQQELDSTIESHLKKTYDIAMDFDVGDALHKLAALGMLTAQDTGYEAVPLDVALERLYALKSAFLTEHRDL